VKKVLAIIVSILFVLSVTGLCFAQAGAPAPAKDTKAVEKKADDKKVDDKKVDKKDKKEKKAKKSTKKVKKEKKDKEIEGRRRLLQQLRRRSKQLFIFKRLI